jgi:hypothetical protein
MFSERQTVSRKTSGDGKLEITRQAAQKLEALGPLLNFELDGKNGTATLSTMECTCRNADTPHVHYFLQAEQFKALSAGDVLDLQIDPAAPRVVIRAAPRDG